MLTAAQCLDCFFILLFLLFQRLFLLFLIHTTAFILFYTTVFTPFYTTVFTPFNSTILTLPATIFTLFYTIVFYFFIPLFFLVLLLYSYSFSFTLFYTTVFPLFLLQLWLFKNTIFAREKWLLSTCWHVRL